MGKEITHECSNLRKNHTFEKNSEFQVIVYCPTPKNDNSELGKCIFYGIAKILIGPVGFGRNQKKTWPMFSELKALIDSERFRVIVFQYRAKNDNSELGIFTSKHDSICKSKFRVIVFQYGAKNDNSEFSVPSMIPRVTKNSVLSFLCKGPNTITRNSEFT